MISNKFILASSNILYNIGKVLTFRTEERIVEFYNKNLELNDEVLDLINRMEKSNISESKEKVDIICKLSQEITSDLGNKGNGNEKSIEVALYSVFNKLNENNESKKYKYSELDVYKGINYPTDISVDSKIDDIKLKILSELKELMNFGYVENKIGSLMIVSEKYLSYFPTINEKKNMCDISMYDHIKLSTAIICCLYDYLSENNENDGKDLIDKKMFSLVSMDISGIQKFIYTITSKGALKSLRARSFYLEILMEDIVDEFLDLNELSRCNLIYSGGGHCYILIANTAEGTKKIELFKKNLKEWMLENYGIELFVGLGSYSCSPNDLLNIPDGSYEAIYKEISRKISQEKSRRYDFKDINKLNSHKESKGRECKVCKKLDNLKDDKCRICNSLEEFSYELLNNKKFYVLEGIEKGIPILFGKKLISEKMLKNEYSERVFKRCYSKNKLEIDYFDVDNLWIGDYYSKTDLSDYNISKTFEEFADEASGIDRIAVLRADVDNLGTAFVSGFKRKNGDNSNVTISRTAAFSRQLSLFFKGYINNILENGDSNILTDGGKRNVSIVYSGGDDVFIVGSWNDVIDSAIDIRKSLEKFTQGTLTISAGIGIYPPKYPINIMAKEVEVLEDFSKKNEDKNSVTLFDKSGRYNWKVFEEEVLGEKYKHIKEFFELEDERGKNFIYNLLNLLRNTEEKINIARYIYTISRLEPKKEDTEKFNRYTKFSEKMYKWILNKKDREQVITAIYLYIYTIRESEE